MSRNIISLTTIPPRMDSIAPTLQSLLRQNATIDAVILWIPARYRRSEFSDFKLPRVPDGIEIRRCGVDYGPATKVLSAVEVFAGQDVRIIYCDDDRLYHPDWVANLLRESDLHPRDCIAEAGEVVELTLRKVFRSRPAYRALKISTLGIYGYFYRKKNRALDVGYGRADICKGYGGVLVRPEFFTLAAFDIPDVLWTVDDIWISGQLAVTGIAIRKITRSEKSEKSDKTALADVSALEDYSYADHDRHGANLACIRYFQEKHGIWKI